MFSPQKKIISMSTILKLVEICAVKEAKRVIDLDKTNVHVSDARGNGLLHIAFAKGSSELIKELINAGADPSKLNIDGLKPRELARDDIDTLVCISLFTRSNTHQTLEMFDIYESSFTGNSFDTPIAQQDGECEAEYAGIASTSISDLRVASTPGCHAGVYRGSRVQIDPLVSKIDHALISAIFRLRHPNICLFMGVTRIDGGAPSMVYEDCAGGPLRDALESVEFSDIQRLKILSDVTHGLYYMHAHKPHICHGNLCVESLVLDTIVHGKSDFVNVKISHLTSLTFNGNPSADILGFGQVALQVFPGMQSDVREIMERCLSVDPTQRPKASEICRVLKT